MTSTHLTAILDKPEYQAENHEKGAYMSEQLKRLVQKAAYDMISSGLTNHASNYDPAQNRLLQNHVELQNEVNATGSDFDLLVLRELVAIIPELIASFEAGTENEEYIGQMAINRKRRLE